MWCALHLLRWKVLYGPCLYNFAQSFVSNYKISFSAKIIKGFRSKGNFAVFIAVQTNFYLIQSDKMPSFLLHTGGGNLPDTGQKTGGRHFNLQDSDQNMFSQTEKVELLKTNNEKSFNSNLIFLPTSAGTTQSALVLQDTMLNGHWPHSLSTWNWVHDAIIVRDGHPFSIVS